MLAAVQGGLRPRNRLGADFVLTRETGMHFLASFNYPLFGKHDLGCLAIILLWIAASALALLAILLAVFRKTRFAALLLCPVVWLPTAGMLALQLRVRSDCFDDYERWIGAFPAIVAMLLGIVLLRGRLQKTPVVSNATLTP